MVDATISFAIEKLSDFLITEVNIRIGVKDGVRWLKDELGYLQSAVRDAEAKQESNHLIRQWINNVKDVANDAVIILERFSILHEEKHAAPKKSVMGCLRSSICICRTEANFYDIGKEIESLKGRVVEIKNRRDDYGITNILANPMVQQRKRTLLRATSFENQVDVVGFEDDFKTLLAEIVREDPSLNVISIHGMGGLGKTTLASKLYHSSELSHFQSRAWVCVSQEYNIKDVLKTIIKSFMGYELDLLNMDEIDLLQHLRKLLLGRDRYLAVIDDIWDVGAWEKVKKAFPDKKNGSRVIITTRNRKVAERVDDGCFVHQLRFLKEDESWQLFCRRAKSTPNLEELGKDMVGKCGGLPLAIVVLSGLLLHKKSYQDWSRVKDNIWRQLKGDSAEIQEILSLSYDDLSLQMRRCFLYLARFPEDHNFQVNKLKLLWIAEEFISEADEENGVLMEDVAENYLIELINRNMIQIVKLFWDRQVYQCRIHDLVRDLAIQKSKEDKLLGIFDTSNLHTSAIRSLQGQPRHAIYNGIDNYLELLGPNSADLKLRSLAVINESSRLFKLEEMKLIFTRFKHLKVLDLTSVKSEEIPEEIGDLVLLKFLGLMSGGSHQRPLVIPPSIGKLKNLQTLFCPSFSEYEFPEEICELKELRHLNFEDGYQSLGRWNLNNGRHQTKLQSLQNLEYSDWIRFNTLPLANLRTLCIRVAEKASCSLDSIESLTSLQSFIFKFTDIPTIKPLSSCKRLTKLVLIGKIRDQSELCFLPDSVTNLSLICSKFTDDPMSSLGSLPSLTGLDLHEVYTGTKMVCSHGAFPCLQILRLANFPNLEELQVEDGGMSCLRGFEIDMCPKLKIIPQTVKCVPPRPDIFMLWNY